jgi:hypothetical protein
MNPSYVTQSCERVLLVATATVILWLHAVVAAGQSAPIAITAPADGTVVNPGQTITVTVTSPAGLQIDVVSLNGSAPFGPVGFAEAVPAQFTVDIPADIALKRYRLTADARTSTGVEVSATITIDVERPDAPVRIDTRPRQIIFGAPGEDFPVMLKGEFESNVSFDVTESSNVTYVSSDPAIATVDARGMVSAIAPGTAEVTATYGPANEGRRVTISILVPTPGFTMTPSSLDFGEQTVGSVSTLPMVLTNSSGEPLHIASVAATDEFSSSDNCVSASPLADGASCTIIVTFSPNASGVQEGFLRIGSPTMFVGFRLRGTVVAPPAVAISDFSPAFGPIGSSVTIAGTGFSATPAQNTVTFNGTAATITSSTTTSIVVTVPTGATTGPIGVTSPAGSATSASSFTVTVPEPPTITGFSPTIGVAGTSVMISGTNFSLVAANNQTKFNETTTTPTASTSTTVTAPVPASTGSGRIRITTSAGTAVSTSDFIIPPSPFVPADVATSGRIAFGTQTPVSVSTANKIGLFLFDGISGQRISLLGTNGLTGQILGCDINVSILKPDNTVLAPATCMEQNGFIDMLTLSSAGTYTILVDPVGAATGGVTLTLYDVPANFTGTLDPAGPATTATMSVPGQNGVLTFAGTAGQRVSLLGSNGMTGQVGLICDVNVTIKKPDGTTLTPATCMEQWGYVDVQMLPATGTYQVSIDPTSWAVGSLTLRLYDVPADSSGTTAADAVARTVTLGTPGQNGVLTFEGTAGQRVFLNGTNGMSGQIGLACDVNVSIKKPDATVLAAPTCMEGTGFIDTKTLPVTGTYTIVVDPQLHATGSVTLTLYDVPADTTGTVSIGGSTTVSNSAIGQNGTLTFSGTSGQQITVRMTSNNYFWLTVKLMKPDGTQLTSQQWFSGSFNLPTVTLPVTGTYTIVVDPNAASIGSVVVSVTNP